MDTIFNLIPEIGSAFSLAAFGFAIYAFMQRNSINKSQSLIELAKEDERGPLIDKAIADHKIDVPDGTGLTAQQRFELAKQRLLNKAAKEKQRMTATIVLGLALLVLVGYQIKYGQNKEQSGGKGKNKIESYSKSKSNLSIIKSTYQELGTAGKSYVNKQRTIQKFQNLDFESNSKDDKLRKEIIENINMAPAYSDPNYNVQITQETKLKRDQLKINIEKEVNKCD